MAMGYPIVSSRMQSRLNDLVSTLQRDLHHIAARHLSAERSDHTLQATALLNEVYVKLSQSRQSQFNDKTHFLAVASRVMRQVLVDYARAKARKKRSSGRSPATDGELPLLQVAATDGIEPIEILELNRALDALAGEEKSLAQMIEMHYFGGMTAKEIAEFLGRSVHVVRHDLRLAHAWLHRELSR